MRVGQDRARRPVRVIGVAADPCSALTVTVDTVNEFTVLTAKGTLDTSTYGTLRDRILNAALEEPTAVIVDVTHLDVPAESAWVVFTSARWHVGRWPEVPITMVCEHAAGRSAIARVGVARYLPVYPSIQAAIDAAAGTESPPLRRVAGVANVPAGYLPIWRGTPFPSGPQRNRQAATKRAQFLKRRERGERRGRETG